MTDFWDGKFQALYYLYIKIKANYRQ